MASSVFTKTPREPGAARAEAAGLRWLAQASPCVAEVVKATDSSITTRHYEPARPTVEAARRAGEELARIHVAGAPGFGSPPEGWDGPNYIGTQPQACEPCATWMPFYAQQRVLPFVRSAVDNGNLEPRGASTVEKALEAAAGATGDVEPPRPARIHGDLWAGNLLFTTSGPRFIDPAAHGGHPEPDLAMLALFGAPYIEDIFATYEEAAGLDSSWVARIPLHQLHPLAVHATTHGASYGYALVRAAEDVLALFA